VSKVRVASASELVAGDMTSVQAGEHELLLARVGEQFFALDNLCTHAEGWLDMGYLLEDTCEVRCPLHEGRFDLRTGQPTHEPVTEPVGAYRTEVVGDDVFVEIDD
jgi:nitrite reductase/ring-hydroxylating ferredoxin subunit